MITFIPRKDEGNGKAGLRAAAKALLILILLPFLLLMRSKK